MSNVPTPYKALPSHIGGHVFIVGDTKLDESQTEVSTTVATVTCPGALATAAFIVRACNTFDVLAAYVECSAAFETYGPGHGIHSLTDRYGNTRPEAAALREVIVRHGFVFSNDSVKGDVVAFLNRLRDEAVKALAARN